MCPQELLSESNSHKQEATSFYLQGSFDLAINKYTEANAVLPNYLDYELAVLQSNISACHLKLKEWKEANVAATTSLDRLDKVDAQFALETKAAGDSESLASGAEKDKSKAVPNDDTDADSLACTKRQADSKRIRYKALMRRARARFELGGWQNLEGALTDYTALQKMDNLTVADRKLAAAQLRALPSLVAQAKEKETAQMWDQLKQARRLSLPCICSLSLSSILSPQPPAQHPVMITVAVVL